MTRQLLVTVEAPRWAASLVLREQDRRPDTAQVVEAAPILRWTVGKRWKDVHRYIVGKGYTMTMQDDPAVTP